MQRNLSLTASQIVAKARIKCGESQAEFGKRFNKTQSQISKYERDELDPPTNMIIQLMTSLAAEDLGNDLSPQQLAQQVRALKNDTSSLLIRRAIWSLLQSDSR